MAEPKNAIPSVLIGAIDELCGARHLVRSAFMACEAVREASQAHALQFLIDAALDRIETAEAMLLEMQEQSK